MTPPSPYRERVVHHATLQSTVSFVTITTLWLAAHGSVGWPPPHCREGFRHDSASGPRTCFPSHRPTPGRVPHLEHSTYALLGAPQSSTWRRCVWVFRWRMVSPTQPSERILLNCWSQLTASSQLSEPSARRAQREEVLGLTHSQSIKTCSVPHNPPTDADPANQLHLSFWCLLCSANVLSAL